MVAFLWGKSGFHLPHYSFRHTHKHTVSGTIMMTTFWKNSYHKSSMVVVPWGRNKYRKNSRVFSNFGIFGGFCTFHEGFSDSRGPKLPFLGWKKLSSTSWDFKGPAVWASRADAFLRGIQTKRFSFFLTFGKFQNLGSQNFPHFWLSFWLTQVRSWSSWPSFRLRKSSFFFWFEKNKKN